MSRKRLILNCVFFIFQVALIHAQVRYINASELKLIGKLSVETETLYERLPDYLKNQTREPIWNLGKNTSGLAIRFRSNSSSVSAKWSALNDNRMNHMTETGIKGLDLYTWQNATWQFVNSARPTAVSSVQVIISNMSPTEREYMLYLPLYDGVTDLQIGVDSTAFIDVPKLSYPSSENPVIFYGTSITQGGCATRPGMSYPNILSRTLNREIVNLGFSGNGQLDYEIAELMSLRTDAGLFVLDFIPNVSLEQVKEKTIPFVDILRSQNQDIPLLFVESVLFTHMMFDNHVNKIVSDKNRALKEQFDKMKSLGYKNIYYLPADNLIGDDGEGTIDGVHLTDVGFMRIADVMKTHIVSIISKK